MSTIRNWLSFIAALSRAAAVYHVSFGSALFRALHLYASGGFSRKEILGYALFVPELNARIPVLISKERSLAKLDALNPPAHQSIIQNKDQFAVACRRHQLPVPATLGWTRHRQPYDAEGDRIDGLDAWAAYLSARLPEQFIAKDVDGVYGSGFRAFRRDGAAFVAEDDGSKRDAAALGELLTSAGSGAGVIIQERLFNDAALSELCGQPGLQTARINTLLHHNGRVSVLFFMFKVLAGRALTDNFAMGTTGNLIAFGDVETGVLRGAVTLHPCGSGMRMIDRHPITGVLFNGFQLPGWTEAVALAKTAQRCYAELAAVGWDVALTGDGPKLIEGNARWDAPFYAPFLMSGENWRRIFGEDPAPREGRRRKPSQSLP
jgi:Sugar-transfer associated ATP-grasp